MKCHCFREETFLGVLTFNTLLTVTDIHVATAFEGNFKNSKHASYIKIISFKLMEAPLYLTIFKKSMVLLGTLNFLYKDRGRAPIVFHE